MAALLPSYCPLTRIRQLATKVVERGPQLQHNSCLLNCPPRNQSHGTSKAVRLSLPAAQSPQPLETWQKHAYKPPSSRQKAAMILIAENQNHVQALWVAILSATKAGLKVQSIIKPQSTASTPEQQDHTQALGATILSATRAKS